MDVPCHRENFDPLANWIVFEITQNHTGEHTPLSNHGMKSIMFHSHLISLAQIRFENC